MTLQELSAGALKLEDELATVDDPLLRAEMLARAAAAEAAQEADGDDEEE